MNLKSCVSIATAKCGVATLLIAQLSIGMAAAPAIGVVTTKGGMRLDNSAVAGNGTLFDGSLVETGRSAGKLRMANGAEMQLGSNTKGRVYANRMVLERGAGEMRNASSFGIVASNLTISAADAASAGRVSISGGSKVHVAALTGRIRVTNGQGMLVAALAAGRALEFDTHAAGASGPTTVTGCVTKKDGRYFVTDETTEITVELQGSAIEKQVGHKVEVTGSQIPGVTPAATATQVLRVAELKELSKRCSVAGAAAAGAAAGGAAAGGAAAGGAATAGAAAGGIIASKAVIAGVIVAAAATGTAVGVTQLNDDEQISQ